MARQHRLDGRAVRPGSADADPGHATLLDAALSGELDAVEYRVEPTFGIEVPIEVPGVDSTLLDPRATWADPDAYDAKAAELAAMFRANFIRFDDVEPGVAAAGPRA